MRGRTGVLILYVRVAQLDRASDYGSEGRGFESSYARFFDKAAGKPMKGCSCRLACFQDSGFHYKIFEKIQYIF